MTLPTTLDSTPLLKVSHLASWGENFITASNASGTADKILHSEFEE